MFDYLLNKNKRSYWGSSRVGSQIGENIWASLKSLNRLVGRHAKAAWGIWGTFFLYWLFLVVILNFCGAMPCSYNYQQCCMSLPLPVWFAHWMVNYVYVHFVDKVTLVCCVFVVTNIASWFVTIMSQCFIVARLCLPY